MNWLRLEKATYKRNADSFAEWNSSIDLLFNEKKFILVLEKKKKWCGNLLLQTPEDWLTLLCLNNVNSHYHT